MVYLIIDSKDFKQLFEINDIVKCNNGTIPAHHIIRQLGIGSVLVGMAYLFFI